MENKKVFVIIGGLWRDRANGNTYNAAKIIDPVENKIYYTRYTYGYGTAYLREAAEYIREELKQDGAQIINGGSYFVTKTEAKNGTF